MEIERYFPRDMKRKKRPLLSFIGQKEFLFPKKISIKIVFFVVMYCLTAIVGV
jgi:hypothetical protein